MPLTNEERDNLVAYLDGELDDSASRLMEARINTDPAVRAEADALKQAWEMLEYLPKAEPSDSFTHRTMDRLALREPLATMMMQQPKKSLIWLKVAAWAVGMALAVVGGAVLAGRIWPSREKPPDARLERILGSNLSVIENKLKYDNISDLDFLEKLHELGLFDEE